ncbi:MAG: hypothetical protein Q9220_007203 [cf. Caloplaca sp. 1 TL-2023]
MALLNCPFCPFSHGDVYSLAQHVEIIHPETDKPPAIPRHLLGGDDTLSSGSEEAATALAAPPQDYIDCECGEAILLSEFDEHVQLHSAESADMDAEAAELLGRGVQTSPSQKPAISSAVPPHSPQLKRVSIPENDTGYASARHGDVDAKPKHVSQHHGNKHHHTVRDWIAHLLGPSGLPPRAKDGSTVHKKAKRLGRAELGPYAHEDQMPAWLYTQLERGAKVSIINQIGPGGQLSRLEVVANEVQGIVPVLAQLCEQDQMLHKVYLCHPGVQHIFKMAKEGGFCGYRNIQMMISFILAARSQGREFFPSGVPSILDLQELIEDAWDRGINTAGRVETGGVRGTRKYIGTPETLFMSLNIECEANAFNRADHPPASKQVYRQVEEHFIKATASSADRASVEKAPPLAKADQGHSLTVVGLEVRRNGSRNLLVFDPSFKPSPGIRRLVGSTFRTSDPEKLLKAYRRGDGYLGKHSNFELLK